MTTAHRVRTHVPAASRALLALATLASSLTVAASTPVPAPLAGWQEWVLEGHPMHRCPWLAPGRPVDEGRVCAWPGVLELSVDEHGARFSERWQVESESWLPLPGSAEDWPQDVLVDGKSGPLVARSARPWVRVGAGAHTLSGTFSWSRRPEVLALPEEVALVSLSVSGTHLAPQRNDAGVLLGAQRAAREDNSLSVRVFRLLADGAPPLLTTRVRLAAGGEAREVRLPQALPAGFIPVGVDGGLPARLDPDGTLRVQVRPGDFELTLTARGPYPLTSATLGTRPDPWPKSEVWSFRADDALRVVGIEGAPATDPAQADVPDAWRSFPAYRMEAGAVLRVSERSRGLAAGNANELHLTRSAWLDFDGRGYTFVDGIEGTMRRGWRLEMPAPYALASVRSAAGDWLLVTEDPARAARAVEVRDQDLNLTALSRAPRRGSLAATGWAERFTQVSGQLMVAPGYRLVAALGPDAAPQAWLERWQLLDVFAVLLIATVALRVLGIGVAALAVAAIALLHQEAGSPTWLWLNVLVALALVRAAPAGRLRSWADRYRLLALALLVLALVPFAITQVRLAFYPQLETPAAGFGRAIMAKLETNTVPLQRTAGAPPPPPLVAPAASMAAGSATRAASAVSGASAPLEEMVVVTAARRDSMAGYEPGVQVQAGPGVPSWAYRVYEYSWSGPVEAQARVHFLISPPWLTGLWRLLGVVLSVALLYVIARGDLAALPLWLRRQSLPPGAAAAALLALLAAAAPPVRAGDLPDGELLTELQRRLLEPPHCTPDCAAINAAHVSISEERLSVTLEVSALDALGVALPAGGTGWTPAAVFLDGGSGAWVHRDARGTRYVWVSPGRHTVRMEGPLQGTVSVSLGFPLAPQRIEVSAPGWDVAGVNGQRLLSGALELVRRQAAHAEAGAVERQGEFPVFVTINRTFRLGHEWTLETQIERLAPAQGAFTVTVPLLPKEAVTTPGLQSGPEGVVVGVAAGESRTAFSSLIPVSETLALTARAAPNFTERWTFLVAPQWHVDFAGVPASAPGEDSGPWVFEYYPRPAETLTLQVSRPAAAPGGTLAFDRATLSAAIGKRSATNSLELSYRSTQGGRQVLHLPADAEVTVLRSDDQVLALRPENGELSLAALPGEHTWSVQWQSPRGVAALARTPAVNLGAPVSNIELALHLPQDRWVLMAFGRGVGPAILYWGELVVFLALAGALGRSRLTPLPTRDWLLLGLGLSTFSWSVFVLFAAFVAVFAWRARQAAPPERLRFNLLQLALALLALVALLAVVAAVPQGLLSHPDMRVAGAGGADGFSWFVDQSPGPLPVSGVVSVSLWWYKLAMLAWALWLSFALTRWVRWAWQVYGREGLWRPAPARTAGAPPPKV